MTRERKDTIPAEPIRTRTFSEATYAMMVGANREAARAIRLEAENITLRRRLAEREQELQQLLDEKEGVHG